MKNVFMAGVWLLVGLLLGCSGSGGSGGGINPPGAPSALAVSSGDGAVGLAWTAPTNNGGASITSYNVSILPAVASAVVTVNGTAAVISGLTNGTSYSISVAASNSAGKGSDSTSLQATTSAANTGAYTLISVPGDPNAVSGIFDPSVVKSASGTVWLAYSSAHYYINGSNQLVEDISTSIAKSSDGGQTFSYIQTVGAAQGPVAVTDTTHSVCGQQTCTGRWIYEVPFMVEDAGDPDPARRFKLFAHKYFLYPPATPSTEHVLGAIVMWTASTPDGSWSAETSALVWNSTPPEIPGGTSINMLDAALTPCLLVTEGSASVNAGTIDFAMNCTYASGSLFPAKIVLLRSTDHANTFTYVSTLLSPADASIFSGAGFFNAPALIPTAGGAPLLMVTPDNGTGRYLGCLVIPFASEQSGTLIRNGSNLPVPILTMPTLNGHFGGACAWDRSVTATGILMIDLDTAASPPFRILATGKSL